MRRQEEAKQSEFKLSFYADMQHSERLLKELQEILDRQAAPFSLISSQDPFTGDGLIDFLPQGVSKAYAVDWWAKSLGGNRDAIIYAGDSGNDLAVFASGVRSILVGNTDAGVVAQTRGIHAAQGWQNRLYHASNYATSGVLEGLQSFCAS